MVTRYNHLVPIRVGVCAIQGDFERHISMLNQLQGIEPVEVRTPEELETVERLIIPGGESTTVGLLMQRYGLAEAIKKRALNDMPLWGTCMGMILLAKTIEDRPDQFTLKLLDVCVKRNAFGAQINSFTSSIHFEPLCRNVEVVFIRAPIVSSYGTGVEILATLEDKIIAVRQNSILGTSFHPELSDDTEIHEYFLSL